MKQYRITSDRLTLGKQGDVISDDALEGVNVEALIAGGHLAEVKAATNNNNKNTEEK
jgi:hypothetical protein